MDRENIKRQFNKYVADYNASDPKIALKIAHTFRVAELSDRIASENGAKGDDIEIAWVIGMLHDIARFEQVRIYNTFNDSQSVDHAEFGVKLLFEDNLISRFEIATEWHELIEKAIRYHNKFRLPEDLSERQLFFCKVIRDADKIDILRVNYETPMEEIYNTTREILENDDISDSVYDEFFKNTAINHSLKRTKIDHLVGHVSLCFELEYEISRKILLEQGYLQKLLMFESKNPNTAKRISAIKDYILKFLTVE